jgi:NitT/TauT family transport system ATP-binding protein
VPVHPTAFPTPSGTPVVALDGVGKTFANGVVALECLDLAVHAGEFVSLLGPSGCGKSTALRIIAGLSAPSRGQVAWADGGAADARTVGAHRIGFVFQEPTLMPWATVTANVRLPLRLAGLKADAPARVDAALARVVWSVWLLRSVCGLALPGGLAHLADHGVHGSRLRGTLETRHQVRAS